MVRWAETSSSAPQSVSIMFFLLRRTKEDGSETAKVKEDQVSQSACSVGHLYRGDKTGPCLLANARFLRRPSDPKRGRRRHCEAVDSLLPLLLLLLPWSASSSKEAISCTPSPPPPPSSPLSDHHFLSLPTKSVGEGGKRFIEGPWLASFFFSPRVFLLSSPPPSPPDGLLFSPSAPQMSRMPSSCEQRDKKQDRYRMSAIFSVVAGHFIS